jgi:hypothetical protein
MGGDHNGNEGKMVEEGLSGGGEQPQIANLTSLSLLGMNSLVMANRTHNIRTIQHINKRVAKLRMKIVDNVVGSWTLFVDSTLNRVCQMGCG